MVAASVILDPELELNLFKDSKLLRESDRNTLFEVLRHSQSVIGVGIHSHRFIDRVNILQATLSAMTHAVERLGVRPSRVLIDGNRVPSQLKISAEAIVKGDRLIPAISAASIVAKVTRDRIMMVLGARFPEYGFEIHKGYGTAAHYEALGQWGASKVHRRTFNLTIQDTLF